MKIKYSVKKGNGKRVQQIPIDTLGKEQENLERKDTPEEKSVNPKMMTVKEVAATGILSEYAIRLLIKEERLPVLRIGNRALINYERLVEDLDAMRLDKGVD